MRGGLTVVLLIMVYISHSTIAVTMETNVLTYKNEESAAENQFEFGTERPEYIQPTYIYRTENVLRITDLIRNQLENLQLQKKKTLEAKLHKNEQEDRSYLPPAKKTHKNEQEDRSYLPPAKKTFAKKLYIENYANEDSGYLMPPVL